MLELDTKHYDLFFALTGFSVKETVRMTVVSRVLLEILNFIVILKRDFHLRILER